MKTNWHKNSRGKIGPIHLIIAILLITAIGIGVYYYLQSQKAPKPTIPTGPQATPIEKIAKEASLKYNDLVYAGLPKNLIKGERSLLLRNIGYCVGFSEERRNPIWAAYKIVRKEDTSPYKRPSRFKKDKRTMAQVQHKDYTKSGYDRGHLAPNSAISSCYGRKAQLETFLMSNITPQRPNLNRKLWQKLEKFEIKWANDYEEIWVFTGPIFDEHIEKLKSGVEIPDAFFKILIDERKGNLRTLAFIVPQDITGKEPLKTFLTNIDEVEKLSHLDFLAPLSDKNENYLEAQTAKALW